jgi:hypothetical protein
VIGSETSGGVRNVVASNIVSHGTEIGIRIKSGRSRGGVVENIRFDNWVIDSPLKDGILVTSYYVRIPQEPVSERTPIFRNISISNVTVSGAPIVADIQGLPEMPIDGLRIRDLVGSGKRGVQAFATKGLELHDVKIDAAEGPAFLIRDSSDLDMDRAESTKTVTGMPAIRLDRVLRALVQSHSPVSTEESAIDYWKGIDSPDRTTPRQ